MSKANDIIQQLANESTHCLADGKFTHFVFEDNSRISMFTDYINHINNECN